MLSKWIYQSGYSSCMTVSPTNWHNIRCQIPFGACHSYILWIHIICICVINICYYQLHSCLQEITEVVISILLISNCVNCFFVICHRINVLLFVNKCVIHSPLLLGGYSCPGVACWPSDHWAAGSNPLSEIINLHSVSPVIDWRSFSLSIEHDGGIKRHHFMSPLLLVLICSMNWCKNIVWYNCI